MRVEILDSNGDGTTLERLDKSAITGLSIDDTFPTNDIPKYFDLVGEYIYLYPTPSYAKSDGLKLYVKRGKSAFTSSDTTKALGIPSLFHQYICRLASLPYLIEFQKSHKNDIASQIQQDEFEIMSYFKWRTPYNDRLTPNVENTR